ncbi:hypothetical protein Tsubulata_006475 [Turnera subulata]|uniref:Uncharacterized protein n=1 Tax=Turnera subulata TaxID=218843 RepID=A0A9Q0F6M8_9ROSI|nr:hypothetical protein Tsubulata_006475 [Turnera subulata]
MHGNPVIIFLLYLVLRLVFAFSDGDMLSCRSSRIPSSKKPIIVTKSSFSLLITDI